jgi:hypothetical protein
MLPSPKSTTGFGGALLIGAPILGTFLLFCGQALAFVVIIVRVVVSVLRSSEASASRAADGSEAVGPIARAFDGALTCALVMMASGGVLIAIGLVAKVLHYFNAFA